MNYPNPQKPGDYEPSTYSLGKPENYDEGFHSKVATTPFIAAVVATAFAAAIAGWVTTSIVQAIYSRAEWASPWGYGPDAPWTSAIYGAIAALLAGVLMYALAQAVPSPWDFYNVIVGFILLGIIAIPFLVASDIVAAIGGSIVNAVIGIVILTLLSSVSRRTYKADEATR